MTQFTASLNAPCDPAVWRRAAQDAAKTVTRLHVMESNEYRGFACSEVDPFHPTGSVILWVPLGGGAMFADVLRADAAEDSDADAWAYGVSTFRRLTGEDVAAMLGVPA